MLTGLCPVDPYCSVVDGVGRHRRMVVGNSRHGHSINHLSSGEPNIVMNFQLVLIACESATKSNDLIFRVKCVDLKILKKVI